MQLKDYQQKTLDMLTRFFEDSQIFGPKEAYEKITNEAEQKARLGIFGGQYVPIKGLDDTPYICLRLPTGGGKTLLATYAVDIARKNFMETDMPLVLWLAPTSTIQKQTADALKNPKHGYRKALDDAFQRQVKIFDIADFDLIRPQDLKNNCCIVVGTIQTLRISETGDRKVYAHNENLHPHFADLSNNITEYSFANLLKHHRPLVIVDEAHKAVTELSQEMQNRINPSAIIEFTATPKLNSNILHSVTAQELKDEEMIKLPIMLTEYEDWKAAVNGAIVERARIEETAQKDKDYIRPIVLFQAQKKHKDHDDRITAEVLKNHLINDCHVDEKKIAIVTGDQRQLDGINLFDRGCPIEFVITVEALKEGWDCSFAYVFCSVSNIKSATDVEQLLGRVLRMPYAKRRKQKDLNKAYACLSETNFGEAAKGLVDKMVEKMGFDEEEAKDNIESNQYELGADDLFNHKPKSKPIFTFTITSEIEKIEEIKAMGEEIKIIQTDKNETQIAIVGRVKPQTEEAIAEYLPSEEKPKFSDAVKQFRIENKDSLSFAEKGEIFKVPSLMARIQEELVLADIEMLMVYSEWTLKDDNQEITEDEFSIKDTSEGFQIYLDGNHLKYGTAEKTHENLIELDTIQGWTPGRLVVWLAKEVHSNDIQHIDLVAWISARINYLIQSRKISINELMLCKYTLARKIKQKINAIRSNAKNQMLQQHFFATDAKPEISFDHAFEFKDDMYQDVRYYKGRFGFKKHFLGPDRIPYFSGNEDGEEFLCARVIDDLPQVKYWIRNVSKNKDSFRLPTSDDNFYPDFIAQLEDGRLLVIEYKGELYKTNDDSAEKRAIGEFWEQQSNGKCLFIMAVKDDNGKDMRTQLIEKIG